MDQAFISLASNKWKISTSVIWSLKYLKNSHDTPKITCMLYNLKFLLFLLVGGLLILKIYI